MRYENILVALDMLGCPNRCRHCFMGWRPNPRLGEEDLRFVAGAFRPYANTLTVSDWNREPDFGDDYKEKWELCRALSTPGAPPEHYELASVWRLARDPGYGPWLKGLGLRYVQLTLFGGQALTDFFTGREGAYQDILRAIDALLESGIAPRIQVFVNQRTAPQLPLVMELVERLELEERCAAIGIPFACFAHQGSCDGEGEKLYPIWPTEQELARIPEKLAAYTCRHFQASSLGEVFGQEEGRLVRHLWEDDSTESLGGTARPVLYVDGDFNVYPNIGTPAPQWRLGNLRTDGPAKVLETLAQDQSPAQHIRKTVPLSRLARACGDPDSRRLFGRGDYIDYLLNRYCRQRL